MKITICSICLSYCFLLCSLPPAERRNYTNVVNALVRVVREEGTLTLWRVHIVLIRQSNLPIQTKYLSMCTRLWYYRCLSLAAGLQSDCSARDGGEHGSIGHVLAGQTDAASQRISSSKHIRTCASFAGSVVVMLLRASAHRSRFSQDNLFCQFLSSMLSGFATTVASLPVDIAKTRIQNMKPPLAGQPPLYTGTLVPNTFCLQ